MATQVQTLPAPTSVGTLLPALSLWKREIVRFYRQRSRVVGVIISPVLFWIVIGSGFGSSFRGGTTGGQHYLDFFFPGALTMIVLFTSIFAMMSLIEDRNEGFLLTVLVAPVSRSAIVLGKVLGGATLSAIQGLIFLAFAPLVGIHFSVVSFALVAVTVFLVAFSLTASPASPSDARSLRRPNPLPTDPPGRLQPMDFPLLYFEANHLHHPHASGLQVL